MDKDLCCVVCTSLFDADSKSPRSLGCGHSLCSECVAKLFKKKKPLCPECRKKISGKQLSDCTINYSLLRLACSRRELDKVLTFGSLSISQSSSCQKDAGECTSHGCRLFFWCTHHHVFVCRDCLVLDHQKPPYGHCEIITAENATGILKKLQTEKCVSKLKGIELLKSKIEDTIKNTEKRRKEYNDEIESTLNMQKKPLSKIGLVKNNLIELKLELNSNLTFDNILTVVRKGNDILNTLDESIDEWTKTLNQSSCKSTTEESVFIVSENITEMMDKGRSSDHSELGTIQSELIAAHLQIKEHEKQAKVKDILHRDIDQYKEQLNKKSIESDSLKKELSERSSQHLLLETQLKNLKSEKKKLQLEIKEINHKMLVRKNQDKEILQLKEMLETTKNTHKNEQHLSQMDELSQLKEKCKTSNIQIDSLQMQLKESTKHQDSLIKKVEMLQGKLKKCYEEIIFLKESTKTPTAPTKKDLNSNKNNEVSEMDNSHQQLSNLNFPRDNTFPLTLQEWANIHTVIDNIDGQLEKFDMDVHSLISPVIIPKPGDSDESISAALFEKSREIYRKKNLKKTKSGMGENT